jgi:hypothetical protein
MILFAFLLLGYPESQVSQVNQVDSAFFSIFFIDLTSNFLKVFFFISDLHRG